MKKQTLILIGIAVFLNISSAVALPKYVGQPNEGGDNVAEGSLVHPGLRYCETCGGWVPDTDYSQNPAAVVSRAAAIAGGAGTAPRTATPDGADGVK